MDNRDISIIGQVAAKLAGALAPAHAEENSISILDGFDTAFEHVFEKLLGDITARQVAAVLPGATQAASGGGGGGYDNQGVSVKGTQHGPLPDWLIEQARAAGVSEVWDNRNEIAGTRKPHFKEVVPQGSSVQGKGFWPPK